MLRAFTTGLMALLIVFMTSCASTPDNKKMPKWINKPKDGAVGSSTTHVRGRHYQEELAIGRARERLAARYGVEVSSIQTIKERVVNDSSYVKSDKEITQRINKTTVKAHVRATWYDKKNDEIWVWVYPVND